MALHVLLLLSLSFYEITTALPVPNYGIALVVPKTPSIAVAVANLGTTISILSGALVGLPASSTDTDLSSAITALDSLVKKLVTVETTLKNSIVTATSNTQSVSTAFDVIMAALTDVNTFLADTDSLISTLKSSTGNPIADTLETSLVSLSTITSTLESNIVDLESGISDAVDSANGGAITTTIVNTISGTLAETVATTLTELKTELNNMVAPVKSLVTGIKNAQLYLNVVSAFKTGVTTTVPVTLNALKTFLTSRNAVSLTLFPRIGTTVKTFLTVSDAALKKYLTGTELTTPMNTYSSLETELKDYLNQVNDEQSQAINSLYSTFVTNAEDLATTAIGYPDSAPENIVSKITNLHKSGSTKATTCQTKFGPQVNILVAALPAALALCMNGEMVKIDLMNAMAGSLVNVPIASVQTATNNMASCGSFPTFALDKLALAQANSCLTSATPAIQDIKDTAGKEIDSTASFISDQLTFSMGRMDNCAKLKFAMFEASLAQLDSQFAAECE